MGRNDAAEAVAELLGLPVAGIRPLGGAAYELQLLDGTRVVAKGHNDPNAVRAEAASLVWLAEPGAVALPRLRAENDRWLVTDLVPAGSPSPEAAESLGRGLAALHAAGAPGFGSPPAGGPAGAAIGLAPMRNTECATWTEFYGRYRIEPYLRAAVDRGTFRSGDARAFEQVIGRLDEIGGPPELPPGFTGTCGAGMCYGEATAARGSSIPRPTAGTVRQTWRC